VRHLLTAIVILSALPVDAADADGFKSLFNGKDLTGWAGDSELWSVEDGCITGKTSGPDHLKYNKFLIWDGGEVGDFEFRCEFRMEGSNNSGVQYRSRHDKKRGDWVVVGYQADIHANPPFTGMLYDEKGRGILCKRGEKVVIGADGKKVTSKLNVTVEKLDLTEWHELAIVAAGNRIQHALDGKVVADITDNQNSERELKGIIAFQVHRGPAMKVQFRNVRLRSPLLRKGGPVRKKKPAKPQASAGRPRPEQANPNWIWLNSGDEPAKKVFFRHDVSSGGVGACRLYAACDDRMTVFVDGKKVLEHADASKPVFMDLSQHIDVESPQKNHVVAIEAENTAGPAGLLVKLDFESGWRDAWSMVSDESWQATTKPSPGWKKIGYDASGWKKPKLIAALGAGPWAKTITAATLAAVAPLRAPTATPAESLKLAKGFQAELLYSVPKGVEGSWVNMCVDPKGRLIVSDQYGSLYRLTPPGILDAKELQIEKINVDIGEAQGLLWAFDSLYVSVNRGQKYDGGLYRVRDTDGDDQLDSVETLRKLNGSGEHGPHAVLPHPDGKSLVIVCGNGTPLTEISSSRVPQTWDEDLLLPRATGRFMRGKRAPGGYICRTDPGGKEWELIATGFRNEFDAAYNQEGELFSYDADMEWDINTPWYRPTRICHVVSGAEFGWRSGGGKWPVYYADSVPSVVNVGPGSPTGVAFGYGAKFPAKYQRALFAADWSYGKLYAVHLEATGATYQGKLEEFVTGTPLPLTDLIINPYDGAMYFLIGGRRVQSGLYRVTYSGDESTAAIPKPKPATDAGPGGDEPFARERAIRRGLETLHATEHPDAVNIAMNAIPHPDRFIRYAARIALEHQPVSEWQGLVLKQKDPQALLTGLMALARTWQREHRGKEPDIDNPVPHWNSAAALNLDRLAVRNSILAALDELRWGELTVSQQLDLLRVVTLTFVRIVPPDFAQRSSLTALTKAALPAKSRELNSELAQLAVYLQAPFAAERIVALLEDAPTQEEQIDYAKTLRHLRAGWTPELRERYFGWFVRAAGYQGGASFQIFVNRIKEEAVAALNEEERVALKSILEATPESDVPTFTAEPRPVVKKWTMQELVPLVQTGLKNRDFDNGRRMFAATACFACHRFDNQGGAVGPDLTALSGRFSPRDILESIVEPSKQISDQYGAVQIVTIEGKVITGRIINLAGDSFRIQTDMLKPSTLVAVDRKQIDEMFPSKTSMMPTGLLNTLNEEEFLDLMAYLLSRGDRSNSMFDGTSN